MFWCGRVKCCILYKGHCLRLNICVGYSWGIVLKWQPRRIIWRRTGNEYGRKQGEVKDMKAYVTNTEILLNFHRVLHSFSFQCLDLYPEGIKSFNTLGLGCFCSWVLVSCGYGQSCRRFKSACYLHLTNRNEYGGCPCICSLWSNELTGVGGGESGAQSRETGTVYNKIP
jgi:hypothetical protein